MASGQVGTASQHYSNAAIAHCRHYSMQPNWPARMGLLLLASMQAASHGHSVVSLAVWGGLVAEVTNDMGHSPLWNIGIMWNERGSQFQVGQCQRKEGKDRSLICMLLKENILKNNCTK